jgi:hypothetical protein
MFDDLNPDNVLLYAAKAYDKPNLIVSEFNGDMKRFNYLKKLFYRHRKYNEIRERLAINHIIILNNVFGPEVSVRLLFYNISKIDYPILKTYLIFLNLMPEKIYGIKGKDLLSSEIPVDMQLVEVLRKIK